MFDDFVNDLFDFVNSWFAPRKITLVKRKNMIVILDGFFGFIGR
jgi:hypothetical protein